MLDQVRDRLGHAIRPKEGGWTPKTEQSNRDMPISKNLVDALRLHKAASGEAAKEHGEDAPTFVFPGSGEGRTWDFRKALEKAIEKANVTRDDKPMHINPHMLRKSFISWQKARHSPKLHPYGHDRPPWCRP